MSGDNSFQTKTLIPKVLRLAQAVIPTLLIGLAPSMIGIGFGFLTQDLVSAAPAHGEIKPVTDRGVSAPFHDSGAGDIAR